MSYEVGDIVTIRDDLRRNTKYYMDDAVTWNEIVDDMEIYKGKEVTIVEINEDGQYKISSGKTRCTYLWVDEMIKGVEE